MSIQVDQSQFDEPEGGAGATSAAIGGAAMAENATAAIIATDRFMVFLLSI